MRIRMPFLVAALALGLSGSAAAQNSEDLPEPLEVGAIAPDFTLPAATRYGVLAEPVHLSDFKGKTVVLAFFFKARTPG